LFYRKEVIMSASTTAPAAPVAPAVAPAPVVAPVSTVSTVSTASTIEADVKTVEADASADLTKEESFVASHKIVLGLLTVLAALAVWHFIF
jgi:hypothetical protein